MAELRKTGEKIDQVQHASFPCVHCGETEFKIILKEDALHRYVCPKCKNPTFVFVSPKLEIIVLREDELCPNCKGTGKCSNCNGTGQMTCPRCNGEGYYSGYLGYYYGCHNCGGSGECKFESDIPKEIIKGKGLVRCGFCLGTGICPTCKGYRGTWDRRKKEK